MHSDFMSVVPEGGKVEKHIDVFANWLETDVCIIHSSEMLTHYYSGNWVIDLLRKLGPSEVRKNHFVIFLRHPIFVKFYRILFPVLFDLLTVFMVVYKLLMRGGYE